MIHYPISEVDLKSKIKAIKETWLDRAKARTKVFRKAKKYNESSNIWSEIKDVFLDIQFNKCAYCERRLGGKKYHRKEYDVEHYRPKSAVKLWPGKTQKQKRSFDYSFSLGTATNTGYYLLAYNVRNYSASCTGCNSSLKSNYFPVGGARVLHSDDYSKLKNEEAYLLCPVGDIDDDPEDIITFMGYLPVPKENDENKLNYKRARVTIDFFDLDTRDDLLWERAGIIVTLWQAHDVLKNEWASDEAKQAAQLHIDVSISPKSPHTSCAKAYSRLCIQDWESARKCKNFAMP